MRIRDDHVKMIRNGKSKLIPMLAIEVWKRDGQFEDSGWTFAPNAKEIYEAWIAEETKRRQRARKRPAVIQRDPGFADISGAVGLAAEAEDAPPPIVSESPVSEAPPVPDFIPAGPAAPVERPVPGPEGSASPPETVEILTED